MMNAAIRTVVIPAAGQGTRLLPLTKSVPKEMLPVYDRPVLQFAIDEAAAAGAERIVIVIHPTKTAIRDYVVGGKKGSDAPQTLTADLTALVHDTDQSYRNAGSSKIEVVFALQDAALGLGHAVLCAADHCLPGAVGVILPDDIVMGLPCLSQMSAAYVSGHMIAAMEVGSDETHKYGIFEPAGSLRNRSVRVSGMVEKPSLQNAPSRLAAVGRYILDPSIFATLAKTETGRGGEIQLTDAIAADADKVVLTAYQFSGTRFDCGSFEGLFAAGAAQKCKSARKIEITPEVWRKIHLTYVDKGLCRVSPCAGLSSYCGQRVGNR